MSTTYRGRTFDWEPKFDDRSRNFPVQARRRIIPRKITWRAPTVLDQGDTGECVGYGHAAELGANPVRRFISGQLAERIYMRATEIDEFPGHGDPQSGTSVLAGAKACKEFGYYSSYRWAFSLSELTQGVTTVGPCVIGINFYESMFEPDENGIVKIAGDVAGGHCMLVRGVAPIRRWVRIRNSWGPGWGPLGGDCRIRFSDMERLIDEDAEMVFPTEVA